MTDDKYKLDICAYIADRRPEDILVDLRDTHAAQCGTFNGAVNIPMDQIRRLYDLPHDRKIYFFCQAGLASDEIAELMRDAGYEAYHLSGGYREYLRRTAAQKSIFVQATEE